MVPGSVRLAPISLHGAAASAVSYAAMNSGDHGNPGNGTFLRPVRRR
jgi:hypothetical protein